MSQTRAVSLVTTMMLGLQNVVGRGDSGFVVACNAALDEVFDDEVDSIVVPLAPRVVCDAA